MKPMRRTLCLALVVVALAGCKGNDQPKTPNGQSKLTELVTKDVKPGKPGKEYTVEPGDTVWVMYDGELSDGTQFDSNRDGGLPYMVQVVPKGQRSMVIQGWNDGLIGMGQGGVRKLEIPAKLAYGDKGQGAKIPPNSDLTFTIDALYVMKKGEENQYDKTDVKVGSGAEAKSGDTVTFHYKASYINGQVFDDSEKRPSGSTPVTVKLGETSGENNKLIPGLDYCIQGMKEGGVRQITLPPSLMFGMAGSDVVSGNQPCVFMVKLLKVSPGK